MTARWRIAAVVLLIATLLAVAVPARADHTVTWGAGTTCEGASRSASTTVNTPVRFIACVTLGGEPLGGHQMDIFIQGPTRSAETSVVTNDAGIARWSVQPTSPGNTRVTLCDPDGCVYGETTVVVTAAPTTTAAAAPTTTVVAIAPPATQPASAPTTTLAIAPPSTDSASAPTTIESTEEAQPGSTSAPVASSSTRTPWMIGLVLILLITIALWRWLRRGGGVVAASDPPDEDPRDVPVDDTDDPRDAAPPIIFGEEKEDEPLIPLVFVPGVMASALAGLDARGAVQQFWPPFGFGGDIRRCLEGLETASPTDFGIDEASEHGLLPSIHSELIRFLNTHGYSTFDPPNLYIYAYNWMLSCDKNGEGLAKLLARIKEKHGRPAHVVVHSLGGLVLRSAWHIHNSRDVDQVAYLASPHYGSPMAYYVLHPNIPYSFMDGILGPVINAAYSNNVRANAGGAGGLSAAGHALMGALTGDRLFDKTLKLVALNCGGVVELLPDHLYFRYANPKFPMAVYGYAAPKSWEEQYLGEAPNPDLAYLTPGQLEAQWLSLPVTMHERVREAMAFKLKISGPLPPDDGTKTLIVYGIHQPTQTELEFHQSGVIRHNKQGGDGTVARLSGQGKFLWAGSPRVEVENSVAHFQMTEVPAVHQMLLEFLPHGGHPPSLGGGPPVPAGTRKR